MVIAKPGLPDHLQIRWRHESIVHVQQSLHGCLMSKSPPDRGTWASNVYKAAAMDFGHFKRPTSPTANLVALTTFSDLVGEARATRIRADAVVGEDAR